MPTVAKYKYIFFFFVSYDVLHEPPHLHFAKSKGRHRAGKIWLHTLKIIRRGDFTEKELNIVKRIAKKYQKEFIDLYKKFKPEKKIQPLKISL